MSSIRNLALMVLLGFLLFGCTGSGSQSPPSPQPGGEYPIGSQQGTSSVLNSGTQFNAYSIQIIPGPFSDSVSSAFFMNETQIGNASLVKLINNSNETISQKQGYSVYFVQTTNGVIGKLSVAPSSATG